MTGNKPVYILARTLKSIDTAWPGTRSALTEYNYGGENHWSGALAQADALGVFGKLNLVAANLHTTFSGRLEAAFRLYRNFDGKGNAFGDTYVATGNPDSTVFSTYASLDSKRLKPFARRGDQQVVHSQDRHARAFREGLEVGGGLRILHRFCHHQAS